MFHKPRPKRFPHFHYLLVINNIPFGKRLVQITKISEMYLPILIALQ